ncbi:Uncharacterised protein [Mycobacteroides abscessus subsp. abscessus]|nr:Uncharacterised protein [Mycobacteroides abscessus subsp. abscessus]
MRDDSQVPGMISACTSGQSALWKAGLGFWPGRVNGGVVVTGTCAPGVTSAGLRTMTTTIAITRMTTTATASAAAIPRIRCRLLFELLGMCLLAILDVRSRSVLSLAPRYRQHRARLPNRCVSHLRK